MASQLASRLGGKAMENARALTTVDINTRSLQVFSSGGKFVRFPPTRVAPGSKVRFDATRS